MKNGTRVPVYGWVILAEGLFVTLFFMVAGLWGWLVAIALLFHMITGTYCIGSDRRIRFQNRQSSLEILPEVTVIVAARDEQQAIGQTLHMLLELDYPNLKVIAVNDRSSDQTGLIMDDIADSDERLLVHHVHVLPDGWLGKNYANYCAAERVESPWLLFTDGDVEFQPGTLMETIRYANRKQLDHLAVIPGMKRGSFWENSVVCTFGMLFRILFNPMLIRSRWSKFYVGVGAFNLIRRTSYEAIGTHRRLAMEILDDLKLGKLIKKNRFRQGLLMASDLIQIRWQFGVGGVVRGLEKNGFAFFGYSLGQALIQNIGFLLVFLFPYLAIWIFPWPINSGFAVSVILLQGLFSTVVLREHYGLAMLLFLPITMLIVQYAMWRSIFLTRLRQGVIWRETFYPLDQLRDRMV